MPQGLQVYNADGTIKLDTSTLLGRIFGSVSIPSGQVTGTIANPQFTQGTPFLVSFFPIGVFTANITDPVPTFGQITYSYSNGAITWVRGTNQYESALPAGTIYYGVF